MRLFSGSRALICTKRNSSMNAQLFQAGYIHIYNFSITKFFLSRSKILERHDRFSNIPNYSMCYVFLRFSSSKLIWLQIVFSYDTHKHFIQYSNRWAISKIAFDTFLVFHFTYISSTRQTSTENCELTTPMIQEVFLIHMAIIF